MITFEKSWAFLWIKQRYLFLPQCNGISFVSPPSPSPSSRVQMTINCKGQVADITLHYECLPCRLIHYIVSGLSLASDEDGSRFRASASERQQANSRR